MENKRKCLNRVYLERVYAHNTEKETADEKDDDGCCIKKMEQAVQGRIESLSDNKTSIAYMTKADERDRGR